MKLTTAIFLLFAFSWAIQRVHAQPQLDSPEDYAYLRRIHVPDVVVNCVAAFDRWVRTAPRYDLFVISERRALSAKVIATPEGSRAGSLTSFDTVVRTPAFAKVRGKFVWVPVNATCQVWHGHVVGLSAQQVAVQ